MIAVWIRRLWPFLAALLLLAGFGYAVDAWRGHPAEQARQQTIYAEHYVYHTDTLFARDTVAHRVAVTSYRTLRDTLRLTDTVMVKQAFARADTAIVRGDSALASAVRRIHAGDSLTARVRDELAIALRPRAQPRWSVAVSALYDPLVSVPAASAEASYRVVRSLSLTAMGLQRFTPGERPRMLMGVRIAL